MKGYIYMYILYPMEIVPEKFLKQAQGKTMLDFRNLRINI